VNSNGKGNIIEYYSVAKYNDLTHEKNVFFCKLAYPNDPEIPNVKFIEWNNELIKIITKEDKHYLIIAQGKTLCCGCGDKILGPLNESQFELKLNEINQIERLKNFREYKY